LSAAYELASARASAQSAREALDDLQRRIAEGDALVTGAELTAAEAEVRVAAGILAGAEVRAIAEQQEADAQARVESIEKATADYKWTAGKLTEAFGYALEALSQLMDAAAEHEAKATANVAAGYKPLGGPICVPTFEEVLDGLRVAAYRRANRSVPGVTHPHVTLERIAPFLLRSES